MKAQHLHILLIPTIQKQSDQSFSGVKNIEELTQADEEEHGE